MQRAEPADGVIDVCQRLEDREEDGSQGNLSGLPLTEDHDREGKEAHACDADLKVPRLNRGDNVSKAADAGEEAGDQNARPAHLVDVDADRARRLRMLAASLQTKTEARFVEQDD